jgi:hypothetical protein
MPPVMRSIAAQPKQLSGVQEALGHKSIAMAVRYSHLSADFQFEALERLFAKPAQTPAEQPTDTTTDTGTYLQVEAQPVHVQ